MQNHHHKPRDMARSVLPSNASRWARAEKARIHRTERSRARHQIRSLRSLDDPDDFEGDLAREDRSGRAHLISERRAADNVGPLIAWATRTVERNARLADAPLGVRLDHFRRILPAGIIGNHALTHLEFVLDPSRPWHRRHPHSSIAPTLRDMVEAIVAFGAHGELNRRISQELAAFVRTDVTIPAARLIDSDHPAPGILIPRHVDEVVQRRSRRFLAGTHDIAAFAEHPGYTEGRIARDLYQELVGDRQVP